MVQDTSSPTAAGTAPHDRHFTCRLPMALVTELRALARANDRTTSAETRRAVIAHLEHERQRRDDS